MAHTENVNSGRYDSYCLGCMMREIARSPLGHSLARNPTRLVRMKIKAKVSDWVDKACRENAQLLLALWLSRLYAIDGRQALAGLHSSAKSPEYDRGVQRLGAIGAPQTPTDPQASIW